MKKVPDNIELEVGHQESVRRLGAKSLALRKCKTAWSQKSGIKEV